MAVAPKDQIFETDFAGIFYFRFWQYWEKVEVVLDDFIPVMEQESLIVYSADYC